MSKRHGHHKGNGGKVIHSKVPQDMSGRRR